MTVRPPARTSLPNRRIAGASTLLLGLLVLITACGEPPETPPPGADPATATQAQNTIVDVAVAAGQFSALLRAVEAAGLTETLRTEGPFTVFAPTDGAFAGLPDGVLEDLMEDPDALAEILLYHVVPGEYTAAEIRGMSQAETVQGGTLTISDSPRGVSIDGASILTADVRASNGIIHVITSVLVPGSQ